ncbi:uncharacterized protein LOC142414397 isoform X1 [Mycteria americana]|uniref:uncharacterized protein LOC142414397 isoform X1 n=1 Tax=Mycteria americana TaxID=33587 RepID=UPI003F589A1D
MIHIYSFGKRRAQHSSHGTPAFLPYSPWENKAPSMCCWRTVAARAAWKSWENDQPADLTKEQFLKLSFSNPLRPSASVPACCLPPLETSNAGAAPTSPPAAGLSLEVFSTQTCPSTPTPGAAPAQAATQRGGEPGGAAKPASFEGLGMIIVKMWFYQGCREAPTVTSSPWPCLGPSWLPALLAAQPPQGILHHSVVKDRVVREAEGDDSCLLHCQKQN